MSSDATPPDAEPSAGDTDQSPPAPGRRWVVPAVVLGVVLLLVVLSFSLAGGAPQPRTRVVVDPEPAVRSDAAADWMTGQLVRGALRDDERDEIDLDATVDLGLSLVETGGHDTEVEEIATAIEEQRVAYTIRSRERLVGPSAKALLLLQLAGGDPAGLQGTLEQVASTDPAFPGRLRTSTLDEIGDVEGQVYGARALVDAGSDRAEDVVDFLLDQQCAEGYFRVGFSQLDSPNQTCDTDGGAPDTDVTALALLMIGPLAGEVDGVEQAMGAAADWLVTQQDADGLVDGGSLAGGEGQGPNAVSTALAARALGAWGDVDAASRAAEAVAGLQLTSGVDRGAVAYDAVDLADGEAYGLGVPPPSDWRRATVQGIAALTWME
ncbi:hypothetical protein [uncultured Nocardioides sp.]|uniref:hypothetical protein n=1 Tax=uncultured Nocardioides sp. TaxID=198441 RepID=UPI0026346F4E|nr:hypothetical protein [uncultured Nocardioides sp.]